MDARKFRKLIETQGKVAAVSQATSLPCENEIAANCFIYEYVKALLDGGADAMCENGKGSTAMTLAIRHTGRGGSGTPAANAQQTEIIRLLERHGMTR